MSLPVKVKPSLHSACEMGWLDRPLAPGQGKTTLTCSLQVVLIQALVETRTSRPDQRWKTWASPLCQAPSVERAFRKVLDAGWR